MLAFNTQKNHAIAIFKHGLAATQAAGILKRLVLVLSITAGVGLAAGALAHTSGPTRSVPNSLATRAPTVAAPFVVHDGVPHNGSLKSARVTELPDGRLVVSMDVDGEFKGLLSVWVERGAGGAAVTGGDWSLVHAYTEDAEGHGATGHPAGEHAEGEHAEGEVFINKGTLGGNITGGHISLNADGSLAALDSLQLRLTSGSLTYKGKHGHGTAQFSNITDQQASTGTIVLSF